MEDLNWTYILYLIVGIPSSLTLCIIANKDKSLSTLFFGLAIISFLIGLIIDFAIKDGVYLAREWGDLTGITFILSALFIKTRNSKPVFARFPLYLTLLPFIVLPFYPLVVNSGIVKELLQSIYQGGAIIVGLLVISINHFLYKGRGLLIFSTLIFLLAFIIVSFLINFFPQITVTLSNILFSIGIIVATIGFKKVSDNRNTQII